MSALSDAIAAWQALSAKERAHLEDYLVDDTRERREELAKISVNPTRQTKKERDYLAKWIRVNEAGLVLLKAASSAPVAGAPALERLKAAAAKHGRLSAPEGFAELLGVDLTDAERAQLRGGR